MLLCVTHSGTSFTSFFKKGNLSLFFIYLCFTVQKKLAACVNIIPGIISVYEWQDKIENDDEVLMMIKTRTSRIPGTLKILLKSTQLWQHEKKIYKRPEIRHEHYFRNQKSVMSNVSHSFLKIAPMLNFWFNLKFLSTCFLILRRF